MRQPHLEKEKHDGSAEPSVGQLPRFRTGSDSESETTSLSRRQIGRKQPAAMVKAFDIRARVARAVPATPRS
jgi:hypothetical protein